MADDGGIVKHTQGGLVRTTVVASPAPMRQAVARAFGNGVPTVTKSVLYKGGKPLASTYRRRNAAG